MSEKVETVEGVPAPETPGETAAAKFERERLSRRAALRKFGMTAGMAAFALFSVDDLARMVGKAMEQRVGDSRVAEQVAREFQQIGIAFAAGGPSGHSPSVPGNCTNNTPSNARADCCDDPNVANFCVAEHNSKSVCATCCNGVYGPNGFCKGYDDGSADDPRQICIDHCKDWSTNP